MVECGTVTTVESTKQAVIFAQTAEVLGYSRVGMADTAPKLYHAPVPAITATLMQTSKIMVGPYVTNPVTRHWSVNAGTARALNEIAPGRYFITLGTGHGAVHSVGLKSAKLADTEKYVEEMRSIWPAECKIQMAFSGMKGVEVAGRVADELTVATGFDVTAIRLMADQAEAARKVAGITTPLRLWVMVNPYVVESLSQVEAKRKELRSLACAGARFSFDFSVEDKNIPDHMKPIIAERLPKYDFTFSGKAGDNPNAHLFDDYPEVMEYLLDRFMLVGTAEQCAARLEGLIEGAKLSGVWIAQIPRNSHLGDHLTDLAATERAFRSIISG
jgi:alkanesulfonate monooxygenase SsuD/methylene tetrahydromethanopterin reductase-like flavin-dependent oxidoreductase (luciferase family)